MPSNHLILCHSLLHLPSIFPSIRIFSNESVLHIRWPKYWSFSYNISPFNVYSGLISFRMDWLDLLAVQGTLKSFVQHRSSKASILRCSAFFIVQLSYPYMTIGKNRQRQHTKRKLQANISDDHRCKNPQQNFSKQNSATHQKAHTPWSSWVYPRDASFPQYTEISQCGTHINKLK